MKELFKSALLVLLICTSLFLSGLLWFSSPSFEDNQRSGYIKPPQIGHEKDKKTSTELLVPAQIIFHQRGKHHLVPTNGGIYSQLLENVSPTEVKEYSISTTVEVWDKLYNESTSLELRFSDTLPVELILSPKRESEPIFEGYPISRIWIFEEPNRELTAWFISDRDNKILSCEIHLDQPQSLQEIIANQETLPVSPVFLPSGSSELPEEINEFPKAVYLPQKSITMTKFVYKRKLIQVEDIKNWLFPDPSLARRLPYKHEFIYTDGSRNLTHDTENEAMVYRDLTFRTTQSSLLVEELNTITQFMNKHSGWTGNFLLERLDRSENDPLHRFTFRLTIEGYPVYGEHEGGPETIELISTPLRVIEYKRSLYYLTPQPEKISSSELLGKKEVLRAIEKTGLSLKNIHDIFPGYQAVTESDDITLQPSWFVVLSDGKIHRIPSPSSRR